MPWTTNRRIPNQQSNRAPALTEFRGEIHIVHPGSSSNDIWHSVFDGTNWTANDPILDQKSKATSALASFQDRLHITHLGDSSNQIWHSSFDGNRWTTNEKIEGETSQAPPAMAEFGGVLHLLHIGNTSHRIYHLEFDGDQWHKRGDNEGLENQRSKGAVALAVFNGELHMVHQGDTSNKLWHTRFNGTHWSQNKEISNQLSKSPPVLATLNGVMHMLHLGDSSNSIWHSTFGGEWETNIAIPYQLAKAAPGLTASGNRIHMAHLGDSSNDIWHSSSDGVLVRRPERRVIVMDLDGVRWDSFYRHLKRVRDANASTEVSYTFQRPSGGSDETVLGDGNVKLHSALAELCIKEGNGMTDVRLALAPYPSFTFPSHGTMYTGNYPGQHGITGHTFTVRDAAPEWDRHSWDSPPRALALQGYCTNRETSEGVAADYLWFGFDTVGENSCRNRNRGIVSDLRVENMFERAHDAGLRSCSIHSFYHGAQRPWDEEGQDQWWRYSPPELSSIKDVCSDEDLDQYEPVDHGAFVKAEMLLQSRPSKIKITTPASNILPTIPGSASPLSGERFPGWGVTGLAHPDGIPDLVAIYLASVDNASHLNGIRDQETYLAWFDHRLARFVKALKRADPDTFENTVFAFTADHGHRPVAFPQETDGVPASNNVAVREELIRILLGDSEGASFLAMVKTMSQQNYSPSYEWLITEAIEDYFSAYAEAMNLYVYIRHPEEVSPVEVARRLLKIPMRTEAYGALVLVRGRYQFLGRGERTPVDLTDPKCSAIVVPHLDVPPASTTDIEEVSLSQTDIDAETALRSRLATSEAFSLLQIAERVAGFQPVGINQSPDVVMLAPAGQSFTSGKSTHGSFAYSTSRIPMVFCGPGMPEGRSTIETAQLVDFAPTVLSLLGLTPEGMTGQPLLDRSGQAIRRRKKTDVPAIDPAAMCKHRARVPAAPSLRRLPRVTAVLHPSVERPARPEETSDSSTLPVLVSISVRASRMRRDVTVGEELYVKTPSGVALVTGQDGPWMEIDGKREVLKTGTQIPVSEGKSIRIRSKRSYDSIDLWPEYVVVPLSIAIPRVPGWLGLTLRELAQTGRVVLEDAKLPPGSITASARDFEQAVRVLERRLARIPDEGEIAIDTNLIRVEASLSVTASVKRAVQTLKKVLNSKTIAGLVRNADFA